MEPVALLLIQSGLSLAGYAAFGFWFVRPWLDDRPLDQALVVLILPQTFRHVGITMVVPGVVEPSMPMAWAMQTAVGDTLTTGLAWVALFALRGGWRYAISAAWVFNVVGTTDMAVNLIRAARYGVADDLGAAWFGPTFVVPAMLVIHVLIFGLLVRRGGEVRGLPVLAG